MGGSLAPIKRGARGRPASPGRVRAQLAERLASRRGEIEAAAATRIHAISDPTETEDPQYVEGLGAALVAAIDYGLAAIELGEEREPPVPAVLLTQARLAARNDVSLDTVLRRYFAGYALLGDFLIEEVEVVGLKGAELKKVLRTQATLFERLLAGVSEEHAREATVRPLSSEQRRAELVRRLLAGELVDASELSYDLEAEHLGAVASGPGAQAALRDLAAALDRRLLLAPGGGDTVWAWLGGRRPLDPTALDAALEKSWPTRLRLALGEPAAGLAGWRLTHRQAKAALPIAQRSGRRPVRYADVTLLAATLQDDLLATSLREMYLAPLETEPGTGETLCETLRAYFAADGNVSSAAALLGVNRTTVHSRLTAIEEKIGRSVNATSAEIETALGLAELEADHTQHPAES